MSKEVETKIEVSKQDFYRLLDVCQALKCDEQLNVYYDCMRRLFLNAATFRIRYQNDSLPKMALKIPVRNKNGRRTAIEIEEVMSSNCNQPSHIQVDQDVPESFKDYLHSLGISRLECLGVMRTQRFTALLPNGIAIELDKVILPDGKEFFEIEIENDDLTAHSRALAEMEKVINNYTFSQLSKFQRFFNATNSSPSFSIPI